MAIIGAGPVGLSAAANLIERGLTPIIFEQGPEIASHVREWSHVRMFSTWSTLIDPAGRRLLTKSGWQAPQDDILPTGRELIQEFLEPLSCLPAIAPHVHRNHRVVGIAREGMDKTQTPHRTTRRFTVAVRHCGILHRVHVCAVIDASGTWSIQNLLGIDGMPVCGEDQFRSNVRYGIPDVLGRDRVDYAGKTVVVVGSGYSAANTVLDLVNLKRESSATRVIWAIRRPDLEHLVKDEADDVPARLALGTKLTDHHKAGAFELLTCFQIKKLVRTGSKLSLVGNHVAREYEVGGVDRIVCNTGQRPNLSLTRELRLSLDPAFECVADLAPLIDPNEHSCYSVPSHGWRELHHPMEPNFYIVGAKSYGRAATFLAITGYQQVRSVVTAIADNRSSRDGITMAQPGGAS